MSNYFPDYKVPKYRQPERDALCRVCDKTIKRNQEYMVSWYSSANRGMYIHICPECVKALNELIPDDPI